MVEGRGRRQFRIRHGLGRGGFGDVYRATMVSPGGLVAEVAIKLLRFESDPNAESVRRLRDEGRLLAALRHPTILRAYDLAILDGRVGLVTEFIEGEDLYSLIRPESPDPIPPRPLLEVIGLVAEGLDAAYHARPDGGHQLALVHRDVKPSNLRLGTHGDVKILDFGIARGEFVDREAHTGTQATIGSLPYMAPERFGRKVTGPEADVYALGCTLYEGLALRRLHPDPVPTEMYRLAAEPDVFRKHVDDALEGLPAGVHPDVVALLRELVAHDPAARPSSRDVAVRCEELCTRLEGPTLKRWARERTWPATPVVPGPLDGRTLTDGAVETGPITGNVPVPAVTSLPPGPDVSSDTFRFGPADLVDDPTSPDPTLPTGPAPLPPPPAVEGRGRSAVVGAFGAVTVALALLVGWAVWPRPPAPPPPPEPVAVAPVPEPPPPEAPRVEVAPVAPVTPEPPPLARPSPARPRPAPPPPPPVVVAPDPVPDPDPVPPPQPAPAAKGKVKVIGGELVRLVGSGGTFTTDTVPGDAAYTVHVRVGPDVHPFGPFTVPAGGVLALRCNAFRAECTAEP